MLFNEDAFSRQRKKENVSLDGLLFPSLNYSQKPQPAVCPSDLGPLKEGVQEH